MLEQASRHSCGSVDAGVRTLANLRCFLLPASLWYRAVLYCTGDAMPCGEVGDLGVPAAWASASLALSAAGRQIRAR